MSLSINEVVNAQIMPQAMAAKRRDLSTVAIFTEDVGEAFQDGDTRYIVVSSATDVANLFGTDSEVYKAAQMLFSVTPRPTRALIARWARTDQKILATANAVKGSTLSVDINILKEVVDGSLAMSVGGVLKEYTTIDLSGAVDMGDVATKLTEKVAADGLKVVFDAVGVRFIIQAVTAGAKPTTKLGYVEQPQAGEYLGKLLKLEDGKASLITGSDAVTVKKESVAKAMTALENAYQNWYGAYFALALTDGELDTAHSWIASSTISRVLAYTSIKSAQIEWSNDNILKKLFDKNSGRVMVQYNNTGDDHAGAALLSLSLSTNWAAQNTAKTLKFKQQTVRSDDRITLNEATKCRRLGINFYTDYDGIPMLAEGTMLGGRFIDEIVGLDAFLDACQKQAFSTLQGSATKIAQTDKGQAVLIGSLNVVGEEFVRNGLLAGGIWRGNEVGELAYGNRLDAGYYFYSDSYDTQNINDREERKAMPIMCAIKLAGAIHCVDLLIQFNR